MLYCGYTEVISREISTKRTANNYSERSLRLSNSIVVPTEISIPENVRLDTVVAAQGLVYCLTEDNRLVQHEPCTNKARIIDVVIGESLSDRKLEKIFVLPVHEEILFLTATTVCNVKQSEIVKWRYDHDTTIVNEEKDVFTLSLLEEKELVESLTGTEKFGALLTNQHRVWMIEGWTSQARDWSMRLLSWQSPIMQVSCGKEHMVALTEDGRVLTMGMSTRGQLGFGSTSSSDCLRQIDVLEPLRFVKVVAGGWHSLVLADSGDIYGWGWNECGQVGTSSLDVPTKSDNHNNGEEVTTRDDIPKLVFSPSLVDTPIDVSFCDISAGSRHSVAMSTDGSCAYVWGWNGYGQLGIAENREDILIPRLLDWNANTSHVTKVVCGLWSTVLK